MKKLTVYHFALLTIFFATLFQSCKKKDSKDPYADIKGNYFSIRQFALDEWNTFRGEPFTIIKTVKEAQGEKSIKDVAYAKIDSSYTNSDTLNWGNIFAVFFATDISDRKFLGKYTFSQFDDVAEGTRSFYYHADDDDLYTQKLLINVDITNNKVKGIYIETFKKSIWAEVKQNLYYSPMKTIQIQTDEKPIFGARKYKVVQYYYQWSGA